MWCFSCAAQRLGVRVDMEGVTARHAVRSMGASVRGMQAGTCGLEKQVGAGKAAQWTTLSWEPLDQDI